MAQTLLDRARDIPSTETQREIKRKYIVNTLKDNCYPVAFINSKLPLKPRASIQCNHKGFV